jgi:hypothetical protein
LRDGSSKSRTVARPGAVDGDDAIGTYLRLWDRAGGLGWSGFGGTLGVVVLGFAPDDRDGREDERQQVAGQ